MRVRLPILLLVALATLAIALPTTGAAATTDTWRAALRASGANGTATVTATGTTGTLKVALKALTASTAYPVKIVKGPCTDPGATLWAAPTQTSTAAGKIAIRVGSGSKLRCGTFTGGPMPTPTPSLAAPTPSPSPSAGITFLVGPHYALPIPAGWTQVPATDVDVALRGPQGQSIKAVSFALPSGTTAEAVDAQIVSTLKSQTGADPERSEAITMDGVPGKALTYHFQQGSTPVYYLEAHCVRAGRLDEINYVNAAGTEPADRLFFAVIIALLTFTSGSRRSDSVNAMDRPAKGAVPRAPGRHAAPRRPRSAHRRRATAWRGRFKGSLDLAAKHAERPSRAGPALGLLSREVRVV